MIPSITYLAVASDVHGTVTIASTLPPNELDRRKLNSGEILVQGFLQFAAQNGISTTASARHVSGLQSALNLTSQQAAPAPQMNADALSGPVREVLDEVARATVKFPTWPTDPLHALAVLGEEFGELTKDMLQLTYEPHKTNAANVRIEAMQTAAMALRLVMSLDRYEYRGCAQHSQRAARAHADEGASA